MQYSIRQVDGEAQRHALQALQSACMPDTWLYPVTRGYWWIADATDGTQAAYACLAPLQDGDGFGYLARAGVLHRHRGNGLQARLIKARETKARRLGLTGLLTDTTDNPASANSLIRCGFRLYEPESPWAFKHTLYWRKDFK